MRAMFTMMNNARYRWGMQGLAIAERAYQQALAFARSVGRAGRSVRRQVRVDRSSSIPTCDGCC